MKMMTVPGCDLQKGDKLWLELASVDKIEVNPDTGEIYCGEYYDDGDAENGPHVAVHWHGPFDPDEKVWILR